jgi:hypothetical protein
MRFLELFPSSIKKTMSVTPNGDNDRYQLLLRVQLFDFVSKMKTGATKNLLTQRLKEL